MDVLAGLFATVGILAALRHRDAGGEGQLVEVNLLSALLGALVNQGSAYTIAGVVPGRMGNEHPSIAPYAPFPTADGELVVAVGNERQFSALCEVLGAPELAQDPRFDSNSGRVDNRQALHEALGARLAAPPGERMGAAAHRGAGPSRRRQRRRRGVCARADARARADGLDRSRRRQRGAAHAQPGDALAHAAELPVRAPDAPVVMTV